VIEGVRHIADSKMTSDFASVPPPHVADSDFAPQGWAQFFDPQGRVYYYHSPTKTVAWDAPAGWPSAPPPPPPPPTANAPLRDGSGSDAPGLPPPPPTPPTANAPPRDGSGSDAPGLPPPPPTPPTAYATPHDGSAKSGSSESTGNVEDPNRSLLSNGLRSDTPLEATNSQSTSRLQANLHNWSSGLFDCLLPAFNPDTPVGLCVTSCYFPFLTESNAFSKMGLSESKNGLTCLFCCGWFELKTGLGACLNYTISSAQDAGARITCSMCLLNYVAIAFIQAMQASISAAHFRRAMIVSAYNINNGEMSCQDVLTVSCCAPCDYHQSMRQLAASPYPQHSFPSSESGQWSSGLFDCFSEGDILALSMFCFPILTARVSNFVATRGRNSECLSPFGCMQCLTSPGNALFRRTLIRQTLSIQGSFVLDVAQAWFCSCCSLAQEARHLRRNCGFQPDGSFSGRNFHALHEN
jgi:Cys-rich protein (TIGR01571 family)